MTDRNTKCPADVFIVNALSSPDSEAGQVQFLGTTDDFHQYQVLLDQVVAERRPSILEQQALLTY